MMAVRSCPNCAQPSIEVSDLLVSNARCPNCGSIVGPHWLIGSLFAIVILLVTVGTTIAVLAQFGVYAAILWFSFPIGAIGFLKARFSPLQVKQVRSPQ